jgi:hypothetical protein
VRSDGRERKLDGNPSLDGTPFSQWSASKNHPRGDGLRVVGNLPKFSEGQRGKSGLKKSEPLEKTLTRYFRIESSVISNGSDLLLMQIARPRTTMERAFNPTSWN